MSGEINGWREWSKFVLKELERLSGNDEALDEKLDQIKDLITGKINEVDKKVTVVCNDMRHITEDLDAKILMKVNNRLDDKLFKKAVKEANTQGKWKFRSTLITAIGAIVLAVIQFILNSGGGVQ